MLLNGTKPKVVTLRMEHDCVYMKDAAYCLVNDHTHLVANEPGEIRQVNRINPKVIGMECTLTAGWVVSTAPKWPFTTDASSHPK